MRIACFLLFIASLSGFSQSLTGLNFNYWYDPNTEFEFLLTPVKSGNNVRIYYQLISNRKENSIETYSITWESRESLTDRSGKPINAKDSTLTKSLNFRTGILTLPSSPSLWYITAKITNTSTQDAFYYYKPIDPLWPKNAQAIVDGLPLSKNYLTVGSNIYLSSAGGKKIYGFLYKTKFNAALPPFAETVRIDPFLKSDSMFVASDPFTPKTPGLYLLQEDTTSAQGFSFLVTDKSYPRFTTVTTLAGPLIYICTEDEYSNLASAKTDKASFDRVILEITTDKERAKNLMRSYFQRVETANRFFTDYKEGWKTDRGMIYIIYGLPDEVSRTNATEIWFYRTHKVKFVFNKTGSVFNPETYKLQRESQYMPKWFALVDLWRKSRF